MVLVCKQQLRSPALVSLTNDDKYCFIWSTLASLYPCENGKSNRVSIYRQYFNELNISGFDFSNGFKCSHMHEVEKLNSLSINIFEINVFREQNRWKPELIPCKNGEIESDKL